MFDNIKKVNNGLYTSQFFSLCLNQAGGQTARSLRKAFLII